MSEKVIRLFGDIHGKQDDYLYLANCAEHSIQLGDLGFDYSKVINGNGVQQGLDPKKHLFIPGNHDNYDNLPPHSIGDYGVYKLANFEFFFIRGAFSIDKAWRIPFRSYWPQEELDYGQACAAIEAYKVAKPKVVITHDCPMAMLNAVITNKYKIEPSNTNWMLERCWQEHKPERWYFGHHHQDKIIEEKGTKFRCLAELSFVDLDFNGDEL